ncbi:MAG: HD domain-containing protein [Elusimicrobia bacterium]|nr:HD domain-containing protein [Candidatus Obscuribacterium magneticum]
MRRQIRRKTARVCPSRRSVKNQVLVALEKKIQRLSEWRRRLSALLKFGKKASVITSLEELLLLLVEESRTVLKAERATVFIVDKERQELWSKVASGTETIRIPLDKGIAGAVAVSGHLLNIRDVYKDPRFNPEVDKKTGFRTRSVLTAPMFDAKNNVIGVFQVLNRKGGHAFDQQDEEVITLLADQASGHIENAQLYQEIRKVTQETIFRLAAAVEYKDHDTRAHLWRMSTYAALVAREMGFGAEWVENLRLASPMHDIGKIGVPDAILNKPGSLTPEEWEEMKKHPTHGSEILQGSDNELMKMSATIALGHHEKWNGTGYPRGLKGEKISMEARIAAIADVFDALTTKRSYKPAMPLDEAVAIIDKETGSHFDPQVVAAFHRCLPKIAEVMKTAPLEELTAIPKRNEHP